MKVRMNNKHNRKLTVSALGALAIFAAFGSVFGTMAWYQYSTTAYASVVGSDATVTENLQIAYGKQAKDYDGFKSNLSVSDIEDGLKTENKNSEVTPITNGGKVGGTKDEELDKLYSHPTYQYFTTSEWGEASIDDYIQFDLTLKLDTNKNVPDGTTQDVYLTDMRIQKSSASTEDFSDAIRVHLSTTTTNMLLSTKGEEITTSSYLDLNGDGIDDYKKGVYEFDDASEKTPVLYGDAGTTQTSYSTDENNDVYPNDDSGKLSGGKSLGTIAKDDVFVITVTIWLEGWQQLENKSIWSDAYLGSSFNVGMTFGVSTL